ncbi:MAG: hypothetical protein KDK27_11870, partial [Leptospiraceae bacterium]|nr:hypothetical protein [Leptospiraceae bacterium]
PREIEDEQIALSRAIRDWEAEIEKERLRKERARLGIWGRFVLFLKSLFGMDASPRRRSEDHPDEEESAPRKRRNGKPRKTGVLVGPREREVTIPAKVQKAIDYVDRNFKGIIWIDEVLLTLGTVKYTADQIGDYLYYDKQNRYIEVKPLINIRRVFLRRENEGDPRWVQATIDYLENVAQPREEHSELLRHLRAIDY